MQSKDIEYRYSPFEMANNEEFMVDGYASTFDTYPMMEVDGIVYSERIDPHAFDDADMSDVVFRVDHEGPVYGRTTNGAVKLAIDEHGLRQRTNLGLTKRAQELFEDIKAGMYPQMSFAFRVAEDHYDKESRTRVIDRVAKVFDISAVSFPANPYTVLSARDYFNGVIEMEKQAERLAAEEEAKRMAILEERRNALRERIEKDGRTECD